MKNVFQNAMNWVRRARPADWLRLIKRLLPHVAIVISGMLIVFFVIDRINKPMGFMSNEFHKRITFVLALLAIYFAVQLITLQRRAERAAYRRRLRPGAGLQRQHGYRRRTRRPVHRKDHAGEEGSVGSASGAVGRI